MFPQFVLGLLQENLSFILAHLPLLPNCKRNKSRPISREVVLAPPLQFLAPIIPFLNAQPISCKQWESLANKIASPVSEREDGTHSP